MVTQYVREHVLKTSSVNSFLTVKVDKCGQNKHNAISRKLSKAQQKVWGMLKAELIKWLFCSCIIKLRFQLRYLLCMNTNYYSKRDISFFMLTHDTLHQTVPFEATSRTLIIYQYHSPWVTKQVLCPLFNHWIYFWIVVRVFDAQVGLICVWQIQVWPCLSVKDINEQCEFPQKRPWAMRVSTILILVQLVFEAIFQQANVNQNLVAKILLPESFVCLFKPQWTFSNPLHTFQRSFVRHVLKNWDFCCYGEIFLPVRWGF